MKTCKKLVLVRALSAYKKYLPTASEHLREAREAHIPVAVRSAKDKRRVRELAEAVLEEGPHLARRAEYEALTEPHRIAVALVAMQGFMEGLARLKEEGGSPDPRSVENLYGFLLTTPVTHQALAVRNCGHREGGLPVVDFIVRFNLTRHPVFMSVYIGIRRAWDARGYDWERRSREEARRA
jgi:hypothetical protein